MLAHLIAIIVQSCRLGLFADDVAVVLKDIRLHLSVTLDILDGVLLLGRR